MLAFGICDENLIFTLFVALFVRQYSFVTWHIQLNSQALLSLLLPSKFDDFSLRSSILQCFFLSTSIQEAKAFLMPLCTATSTTLASMQSLFFPSFYHLQDQKCTCRLTGKPDKAETKKEIDSLYFLPRSLSNG